MERLVALRRINHSAGTIEIGQQFLAAPEMAADLLGKRHAVRESDSTWLKWVDGIAWPGATVVCIASGPSLTPEQCEAVRVWRDASPPGRRVIVVNTSYQLAPWADVLYACDARWWDRYIAPVRATFKGALWTQDKLAVKHGVQLVRSLANPGLGKQPGVIHQGSNSGYQAINLAWQAGATRIVLVGYDMRHNNGRLHWHGDHPGAMHSIPGFADWLSRFAALADDLKREAVEVVNCTPDSALTVFQKKTLSEGLQ